MRMETKAKTIAWIVLGVCGMLAVPGIGMAGESQASGWYVAGGAGVNWISDMDQAGWNRDTICYPGDDCGSQDIGGYRWYYDLDADSGSMLEVAVGRRFGNLRVELSANHRENDIDQKFSDITYLDGSPVVPRQTSSYSSEVTISIDDLETSTLLLNVYYDFPLVHSRITPYVGAGVGLSYTKLSGVFFRDDFSCTTGCNASPAEFYNSFQDENLSDTVFSRHLYAGADYSLNDSVLLGMKVTYSLVNSMSDTGRYIDHPVPDLPNHTRISDMDHWSLTLGLKYLFGH